MAGKVSGDARGVRFPVWWVLGIAAVALLAFTGRGLWAQADNGTVVVYKSPTCGCCSLWVDHLRANGFRVETHDVANLDAVRRQAGVPARLGSCHTARVGGYVIEGHVPAAEIRRLLQSRPRVDGLAVPGMPIGSPGMEMGGRIDAYDVLAFNRAGETTVFARYPQAPAR